jgi:sugar phosphate permease
MAYVAFYLCRKNFSVIMPILSEDNGITIADLGEIIFGFSAAYAAGQFVMGILADLLGARFTVPAGMIVSALAVALMGFRSSVTWLIALQIVNGLAQSTGWSGLSRLFRSSFPRQNRGITMGWWTTNYVAGSFLATMLAAYALSGPWFPALGWRRAVWAPAIVLLAVALLFQRVFRGSRAMAEDAPPPRCGLRYLKGIFKSGRIQLLAIAYLLGRVHTIKTIEW